MTELDSRLVGRVVVITGAGQGIGEHAARELAQRGARVVVAERSETGEAVAATLRAAGHDAIAVRVDVAEAGDMRRLRTEVLARHGRVDAVVCNAAAYVVKPMLDQTVEEFDRVLAVNLRGAFLAVKEFLPTMIEQKEGTLVFVESAEGMPYVAPYAATKSGLRSLMLSLAAELGEQPTVTVFGFAPGMVATPGGLAAFGEIARIQGMDRDAWLRATGVPLVPAELCGRGLAGAIASAKRFHGTDVDHVTGLRELGLARDGRTPLVPAVEREGASPALVETQRAFAEAVGATAQEYEEVNRFMRPIAKRMFRQAMGLDASDLARHERELGARLAEGKVTPHTDEEAERAGRFAAFMVKQAEAAAPYYRDPADLAKAVEVLARRRAAAEAYAAAARAA